MSPTDDPIDQVRPSSTVALTGDGATAIPWSEARERLAGGESYWLATARADGWPHARPVLAVWVGQRAVHHKQPRHGQGA
jgi:hypothetical protein